MKLPRKKQKVPSADGNWHPSFRFDDRLPDLKVVRTSFFVNLVFVTAAFSALTYTAIREYRVYNYSGTIATADARVQEAAAENAKLLRLSTEFNTHARKFNEIEKFSQAPFQASELLLALSGTIPRTVDFNSISFEKGQLLLRGSIREASSDKASAELTKYLDVLRRDELVGKSFPEVSLTSLLRDPRTQGLSFEIVLKSAAESVAKNAKA